MNTTERKSPRFKDAQVNRTLRHAKLIQPSEIEERKHLETVLNTSLQDSSLNLASGEEDIVMCHPCSSDDQPPALETDSTASELYANASSHTFVVLADSQLGMSSLNSEWETELNYCRLAVEKINSLIPRPKFACVCGDLVDMESSFYYNNPNALKDYELEDCERIQKAQFNDFQKVFSQIHPDIALVCLCGNHDIGNRPTAKSIETFKDAFGDEYLAFWANGTYNIVLNNVLFTNPEGASDIFHQQLDWLEEKLKYAAAHQASQIFVFSHHPWFLYNDNEDIGDFGGHGSSFPKQWDDGSGKFDGAIFPDLYFSVPKQYRDLALDLFKRYKVTAAFSGHFHQNLVSKSSFGMDMIVTGPLSMVFDSSGKPPQNEVNSRGFRVVEVSVDVDKKQRSLGDGSFRHTFLPI